MRIITIALPIAMMATACSRQEAPKPQPMQLTVHEYMTSKIDVDADVIWGIGNAAIDNQAGIDPSKMRDVQWRELEKAAGRLADHAGELSQLHDIQVTRPGVKIADEGVSGAPTPNQIQAHIAQDPELFRSLAAALAKHNRGLASAAQKHDALTSARLINELDGVCESCHMEFWFPEQKELIRQLNIGLG